MSLIFERSFLPALGERAPSLVLRLAQRLPEVKIFSSLYSRFVLVVVMRYRIKNRRLHVQHLESRFVLSSVSFVEHEIISSEAARPRSVFSADLDGDNDLDIVSASYDTIAWHENLDGRGDFGRQQVISKRAYGASSVYAVDIDGDGDIDLLSASSYDSKIAWYENTNGRGGFGPQRVITTSAEGANSVFAVDLDGDGDMDVLSASTDNDTIEWYENWDGQGSFDDFSFLEITTNADGASSVFAADIDGDGDSDVLSASRNDNNIRWYENTGDPFSFEQHVITNDAEQANSVFAADLDGDGDLDVLSSGQGTTEWYENTGTGRFGQPNLISAIFTVSGESVYAADIDGDGDLDVIVAELLGGIDTFVNTDGQGTFQRQQELQSFLQYGSGERDRPLHIADLDGDGDQDIAYAAYFDSKVVWHENVDGFFGPQQAISNDAPAGVQDVYAEDLDGDGDKDVVSVSRYDRTIAWYQNTNGEGAFGPEKVIATAFSDPWAVYTADLNGDGNTDVLSAANRMSWYENISGAGIFGATHHIGDGGFSMYPADLDGDNDIDVLSAGWGAIAWNENDGTGSFGPRTEIASDIDLDAIFSPDAVFAADVDGDGDADVLSASNHKIAWYENRDGSGDFGPQELISTEFQGSNSIHVADLDADGDADVILSSRNDHTIAWFRNADGLGTYELHQQIDSNFAESVFAEDIDGDGDLDVVSAGGRRIEWLENIDGLGTLRKQLISNDARGATAVYATDVDGDGDVDVLSASRFDDKIAWYENRNAEPFVVTTEEDQGTGTLRWAIQNANENPGHDTITFAIPGEGIKSISLQSPLPVISDSLTIDGTSQAGFISTPLIELNGSFAGAFANGLEITSGYSTIQGLAINRFDGHAVYVRDGGSNQIIGNHIGADPTGIFSHGNNLNGVYILNSARNTVGGTIQSQRNIVMGNENGIEIDGLKSFANIIQGNLIGENAAAEAHGNEKHGILIDRARNSLVGGLAAGEANRIVGSLLAGVAIVGDGATSNSIVGNSFSQNEGIPIDLGQDGRNSNDSDDVDSGPNNHQNYPSKVGVILSDASTVDLAFAFRSLKTTSAFPVDLDFYKGGSVRRGG